MDTRNNYLIVVILVITYVIGLTCAFWYQTDFGMIQVSRIAISGPNQISAFLYRPATASEQNPAPAVIATHGISGSKEMLNSIALELAKNGFVTLTVDLVGHGDSEGAFGSFGDTPADKTLGLNVVVHYLLEQLFVDASQIGLVGHSLGAGAVRATAASTNIGASVFIAGGIGDMVTDPEYGILNATFPKNLLMIVGEHDVLFNINQIKNVLRPLFGNPTEIVPVTTYGRFSEGTARRLVLPKTTHLFEPVDPTVVSEVLNWMKHSLNTEHDGETSPLTYIFREFAILVSGIAFTALVFPLSSIIFDYRGGINAKRDEPEGYLRDWQILLLWGTIGLLLFLPMFFFGSLIPFPSSVFGNSFAWWLLSVGIVGLLIARFILPNYTGIQLDLSSTFRQSFSRVYVIIGMGIVALLYTIVHISETLFLTDLRISVIPLFNSFLNTNRVLVFWTFIPFYLLYFFVENLYLLRFRQRSASAPSQLKELLSTVALRTIPYIVLIAMNYFPMFMLNLRVFPSFLGFIMEFLLGMIPFFVLSTLYSWWFYNKTHNLATGITVNAFLFAWLSAAVFPILI